MNRTDCFLENSTVVYLYNHWWKNRFSNYYVLILIQVRV